MLKPLLRIVSLLVVCCLVIDSALANSCVTGHPSMRETNAAHFLFEDQALGEAAISTLRARWSIARIWAVQMALTLTGFSLANIGDASEEPAWVPLSDRASLKKVSQSVRIYENANAIDRYTTEAIQVSLDTSGTYHMKRKTHIGAIYSIPLMVLRSNGKIMGLIPGSSPSKNTLIEIENDMRLLGVAEWTLGSIQGCGLTLLSGYKPYSEDLNPFLLDYHFSLTDESYQLSSMTTVGRVLSKTVRFPLVSIQETMGNFKRLNWHRYNQQDPSSETPSIRRVLRESAVAIVENLQVDPAGTIGCAAFTHSLRVPVFYRNRPVRVHLLHGIPMRVEVLATEDKLAEFIPLALEYKEGQLIRSFLSRRSSKALKTDGSVLITHVKDWSLTPGGLNVSAVTEGGNQLYFRNGKLVDVINPQGQPVLLDDLPLEKNGQLAALYQGLNEFFLGAGDAPIPFAIKAREQFVPRHFFVLDLLIAGRVIQVRVPKRMEGHPLEVSCFYQSTTGMGLQKILRLKSADSRSMKPTDFIWVSDQKKFQRLYDTADHLRISNRGWIPTGRFSSVFYSDDLTNPRMRDVRIETPLESLERIEFESARRKQYSRVMAALGKFQDEELRQIIIHTLGGAEPAEIAQVLGLTADYIAARVAEAIAPIQQLLKTQTKEEEPPVLDSESNTPTTLRQLAAQLLTLIHRYQNEQGLDTPKASSAWAHLTQLSSAFPAESYYFFTHYGDEHSRIAILVASPAGQALINALRPKALTLTDNIGPERWPRPLRRSIQEGLDPRLAQVVRDLTWIDPKHPDPDRLKEIQAVIQTFNQLDVDMMTQESGTLGATPFENQQIRIGKLEPNTTYRLSVEWRESYGALLILSRPGEFIVLDLAICLDQIWQGRENMNAYYLARASSLEEAKAIMERRFSGRPISQARHLTRKALVEFLADLLMQGTQYQSDAKERKKYLHQLRWFRSIRWSFISTNSRISFQLQLMHHKISFQMLAVLTSYVILPAWICDYGLLLYCVRPGEFVAYGLGDDLRSKLLQPGSGPDTFYAEILGRGATLFGVRRAVRDTLNRKRTEQAIISTMKTLAACMPPSLDNPLSENSQRLLNSIHDQNIHIKCNPSGGYFFTLGDGYSFSGGRLDPKKTYRLVPRWIQGHGFILVLIAPGDTVVINPMPLLVAMIQKQPNAFNFLIAMRVKGAIKPEELDQSVRQWAASKKSLSVRERFTQLLVESRAIDPIHPDPLTLTAYKEKLRQFTQDALSITLDRKSMTFTPFEKDRILFTLLKAQETYRLTLEWIDGHGLVVYLQRPNEVVGYDLAFFQNPFEGTRTAEFITRQPNLARAQSKIRFILALRHDALFDPAETNAAQAASAIQQQVSMFNILGLEESLSRRSFQVPVLLKRPILFRNMWKGRARIQLLWDPKERMTIVFSNGSQTARFNLHAYYNSLTSEPRAVLAHRLDLAPEPTPSEIQTTILNLPNRDVSVQALQRQFPDWKISPIALTRYVQEHQLRAPWYRGTYRKRSKTILTAT